MGREHVAYGSNYHPCPCAQVQEHPDSRSGKTYYYCKCLSPKRTTHPVMSEASIVKVCCGGTVNGKRYTSCEYYVRGAKVAGSGVKVKHSFVKLALVLFFAIVFFNAGIKMINDGGIKDSPLGIFICFAIALCLIASLFKNSGIIHSKKSSSTKKKNTK